MIGETYQDTYRKVIALAILVATGFVSAILTWRLSTRLDQTLIAGVLMFLGVQLAILAPRACVMATLIFIPLSGDLRRIMLYYVGKVDRDPILLVAPVALGTLLFSLAFRGKLLFNAPFSRMIFSLSLLMVIQAANPMQGGLMVGLIGLMLFLVPLSWYWVGSHYGTEPYLERVLFGVVVPVAVAGAIYSLHQITFGLSDIHQYWLIESGMWRMAVKGTPRPLAFFSSAQEAGLFYGVATVVLTAGALTGRNRKLLVLLPLLLVVVFLQGSRGLLVIALFTICLLWAMNGRGAGSWISRLALAILVGFGGLAYLLTSTSSTSDASSAIAPIVQHHNAGLTKPTDSTLPAHLMMAAHGILSGTFKNPVGYGIGSTTVASEKLNEDNEVGNMEVDFSNMFLSLGVFGGVLYFCIIAHTFRRAVKLWNTTRRFSGLAICGICFMLFGHYLSGMAYSVVPLAWFVIGALDKQTRTEVDPLG